MLASLILKEAIVSVKTHLQAESSFYQYVSFLFIYWISIFLTAPYFSMIFYSSEVFYSNGLKTISFSPKKTESENERLFFNVNIAKKYAAKLENHQKNNTASYGLCLPIWLIVINAAEIFLAISQKQSYRRRVDTENRGL